MKRVLVSVLAALYVPLVAYLGGWEFERGSMAAFVAMTMPVFFFMAYTCPWFWEEE